MYFPNSARQGTPFGGVPGYGYGGFQGPLGELVPNVACTTAELAAIRTALSRPTLTTAELNAAVQEALRRAVRAANHAATLLETRPRAATTVTRFRGVFGAGPGVVPRWRTAGSRWRDLGDLVARRLRFASRILGGNQIAFRCSGCSADAVACTFPPRYGIRFGLQFWRWWNAGHWHFLVSTLVHEATHIYFHRLTSHNPDNRRAVNANPSARSNSPYCYALITTRLNDFADKPHDVTSCAAAQ